MSSWWRYAAWIGAGALCVVLCVYGTVVFDRTVVHVLVPVGVALVIAAVTLPLSRRLWPWLTDSSDRWVNALCHTAIIGSIAYSAFLSANIHLADPASGHVETVMVTDKQHKTHDTYRRIRKNRYVKDGVRHTYHVEFEFNGGTRKTVQVSNSLYRHYRNGCSYDLIMQKGLFGIPVIKDMI